MESVWVTGLPMTDAPATSQHCVRDLNQEPSGSQAKFLRSELLPSFPPPLPASTTASMTGTPESEEKCRLAWVTLVCGGPTCLWMIPPQMADVLTKKWQLILSLCQGKKTNHGWIVDHFHQHSEIFPVAHSGSNNLPSHLFQFLPQMSSLSSPLCSLCGLFNELTRSGV